MKVFNYLAASLLALGLAACGKAQETPAPAAPATKAAADMPTEGSRPAAAAVGEAAGNGSGQATGTIRSVGQNGDFLTIEHGPFDGIDMGAMTMGFGILDDVDLSGFAEGDAVSFMVKQGRDGSFRITSICNTATDGTDCLTKPGK
ncbi:MAG TPA: copper-binding protein [Hyphomonas sp.]|uniref:copper-binding protein n=1 Tax=Hyphomonas sp. TaxID=87 RepID=UPI0025BDE61A|nr:copper-binding protein [Hyphomonas sp.]HRI99295.1 copper-binding protein [Hyphomonas sp.]